MTISTAAVAKKLISAQTTNANTYFRFNDFPNFEYPLYNEPTEKTIKLLYNTAHFELTNGNEIWDSQLYALKFIFSTLKHSVIRANRTTWPNGGEHPETMPL